MNALRLDTTLTRDEALDALQEAYDSETSTDELQALSLAWTGHANEGLTDSELADRLVDFVVGACMNADGDTVRARGPRGDDPTGIVG